MTMDENTRAELERFTNPDKVKEAEQEQGRPFFRAKYMDFTADIGDIDGPYDVILPGGQTAKRISIQFKNMNITKATEALQIMEDKAEIDWPNRPNSNTEVALMVASAAEVDPSVNSIVKFPGLKSVKFEERVFQYDSRKETDEILTKDGEVVKDKDGKPRKVWADIKRDRYYWHVVSIGKSGSSSTTSSDTPSDDALNAAYALIIEKGEEGIEEPTFKGAALRDKTIQGDKVLMSAISNGSWITYTDGKVLRDGEKLVVVG